MTFCNDVKPYQDFHLLFCVQDLSIEELEKSCYDKFDLRLEALQVLIAKAGKQAFLVLLIVSKFGYSFTKKVNVST